MESETWVKHSLVRKFAGFVISLRFSCIYSEKLTKIGAASDEFFVAFNSRNLDEAENINNV